MRYRWRVELSRRALYRSKFQPAATDSTTLFFSASRSGASVVSTRLGFTATTTASTASTISALEVQGWIPSSSATALR